MESAIERFEQEEHEKFKNVLSNSGLGHWLVEMSEKELNERQALVRHCGVYNIIYLNSTYDLGKIPNKVREVRRDEEKEGYFSNEIYEAIGWGYILLLIDKNNVKYIRYINLKNPGANDKKRSELQINYSPFI